MTSLPSPAHLPEGWSAGPPGQADVAELTALLRRHETAVRGSSGATAAGVQAEVTGAGLDARHHVAVRDERGAVRAWGSVHDRAAGRSVVAVVVDPDVARSPADRTAQALFDWAAQVAGRIGAERGVPELQLDSGAFADDPRQQDWLAEAGFTHVRSWWQMTRPAQPQEADPGTLPEPKPGVRIRRVRRDDADGLPRQSDLAAVHAVLEAAFTDHFNYHEESFEEFCSRLRADPGHRWDHWWLATLQDADGEQPVGALVSAVAQDEDGSPVSTYVEYLGVLRTARGRGVATSLLHAVFADTARRGRSSIGIEVDRDSSTGAAELYLALGFVTGYETQSWHRGAQVQG